MKQYKPTLAGVVSGEDFERLPFPKIATPKLDGIRCTMKDGAKTRTMKDIPNHYIRNILNAIPAIENMDGEILTYTDGKLDPLYKIQSKVMKRDGEPDFKYHVFDDSTDPDMPYDQRIVYIEKYITAMKATEHGQHLEYVPDVMIHDFYELADIEQRYVDEEGWEGVMVRDPKGPYKYGRSSFKQGILLKIKRFFDDEATITGVKEMMHNENEATEDAFGRTKRSTAKDGLIPAGTMGKLVMDWKGIDFELGSGFTADERQWFWDNREKVLGEPVTFKYLQIGPNGRPLSPIYRCLRRDLK